MLFRSTTFRYFARRCFHEGLGKAALAALDGARSSTADRCAIPRRHASATRAAGTTDSVFTAAEADGFLAEHSLTVTEGL